MAYRQSYEHLHGWAADLLVALDIIDSGLLGLVARASPLRRQAILCVLAHVGEAALARITAFGAPVLCDEIIALHLVARDLRRLPTAARLSRHVAGADDALGAALSRTAGIQSPSYYHRLAGRSQCVEPEHAGDGGHHRLPKRSTDHAIDARWSV